MALVSVVIPSCSRPRLLRRAISSALGQSLSDIEVLVVIDGHCSDTRAELDRVRDPRLRVVSNASPLGASASRNRGVAASSAEWTAFLDDDDEWIPTKLEKQLQLARQSKSVHPVITSLVKVVDDQRISVWPRRLPHPDEHIGEYLFCRKQATKGEALISTITLMARKALWVEYPFNEELRRHQEWDWLLRVSRDPRVSIEWVPEVLAIWYVAHNRTSISSTSDWMDSLRWLQERREWLTQRAQAGFIATVIAGAAARQHHRRAVLPLAAELHRAGCRDIWQWLLLMAIVLLPTASRDAVRALSARWNRKQLFVQAAGTRETE